MSYEESQEFQQAIALKHYTRALQQRVRAWEDDVDLIVALPLLRELRETQETLRRLTSLIEWQSSIIMEQEGIEGINTPEWSVELKRSTGSLNQQIASEEVLEAITKRIKRSYRKIPDAAIEGIAANVYWTALSAGTMRFSKTGMSKLRIPPQPDDGENGRLSLVFTEGTRT